jgi:tRNA (cytidine/uridine-2'-O-)-methyltransferase
MAFHVVLVEPEIPPNTGNIARTCAATGTVLHLVEPLGFSVDDRSLKRAGLDYWPYVEVRIHSGLDAFLEECENRRMYLATTKGKHRHTQVSYQDEDMLVFGKETGGLPKDFITRYASQTIRIPMSQATHTRSFNLSNAVNIVLFEALRQLGFPEMS